MKKLDILTYFKILGYFALFLMVIAVLLLWSYFAKIVRSPYFNPERGIADIRTIPIKFSGGNGKYYTAEIPKNYLFMDKKELSEFTHQKISTKVRLWTAYPSFKGYFPGEQVDNWIFFGLTQADDFSESQLQARLGQKGVQALFDEHWRASHTLSKQQPYGNPIEYVVKWKPEQKDYIYDAGDHAVRIECRKAFQGQCEAYKLWSNTHVVIEYRFSKGLLQDFGRIEAEIDKLIHSFNFREMPLSHGQAEATKQKKWSSYYHSCYPHHYATMLGDVDGIVESDEGEAWQSDDSVTALVRQYIPVGCELEQVTGHLKSFEFIVEKQNPQQSAEVILKIPLRQNKRFIWLRPSLEIRITHKQDRVESVTARINHPDFF
jgi:hypothetical protein